MGALTWTTRGLAGAGFGVSGLGRLSSNGYFKVSGATSSGRATSQRLRGQAGLFGARHPQARLQERPRRGPVHFQVIDREQNKNLASAKESRRKAAIPAKQVAMPGVVAEGSRG